MREYFTEPPAFGRNDEDSKPSAFEVAQQKTGKTKLRIVRGSPDKSHKLQSAPSRQSNEDWAATLRKDVEDKTSASRNSVEDARRQAKSLWKDESAA